MWIVTSPVSNAQMQPVRASDAVRSRVRRDQEPVAVSRRRTPLKMHGPVQVLCRMCPETDNWFRAPLHWFRSALRRKECFMRFTKIVPKKAWSMQIALMRRQIR